LEVDSPDPSFYGNIPLASAKASEVPGRKAIKDFFLKQFITTDALHKLPDEQIIFENDQRARINIVNDAMTSAYNALLFPYNKTLFAKPPNLLLMEHLALTLSVDHLRHILLASMKELSESLASDPSQLMTEKRLLMVALRDWAMKQFGKELYT
jgi:hypothetical protein